MDQKSSFNENEEVDEKVNVEKRGRKVGNPFTKCVSRKMLEDWYLTQEKSLEEIAKLLGCTRPMVQILMKRHDIQRRRRSAARVLAIKKNKIDRFEYDDIDEDFFSRWTPEMAWVLGLLFTDGNVQRSKGRLKVSISSIDYDLLENVRNLLRSTRAIRRCAQSYDKSKYYYKIEFYREKMRDDLHTLGLLERKSLNMRFPDVPEVCMRHFIRGCWDGDGSVFLSDGKLRASYVSGSLEFIKTLVDELYKIGVYRRFLRGFLDSINDFAPLRSQYPYGQYPLKIHVEKRSKAPSYNLKIDSRENLMKLFHYFYDGIDESLFLRRKYDVFVKGLNISVETQKAIRERPFSYTPIPIIRHEPHESTRCKKTENGKARLKKKQNKKVLRIKNDDGRLKCMICGAISEILYMINDPYCPSCFTEQWPRYFLKSNNHYQRRRV